MIFLCGLFFTVENLPMFLCPLFYILPLTYGADILHYAIKQSGHPPLFADFILLAFFCEHFQRPILKRLSVKNNSYTKVMD